MKAYAFGKRKLTEYRMEKIVSSNTADQLASCDNMEIIQLTLLSTDWLRILTSFSLDHNEYYIALLFWIVTKKTRTKQSKYSKSQKRKQFSGMSHTYKWWILHFSNYHKIERPYCECCHLKFIVKCISSKWNWIVRTIWSGFAYL